MFSQLPIVDQFRVRNALNDLQDAVKQYRDKRERQLKTEVRNELQRLADAVLAPPIKPTHDDLELSDPIGSMTVGDDDDLRLNFDPETEMIVSLDDSPIKRDIGIGGNV